MLSLLRPALRENAGWGDVLPESAGGNATRISVFSGIGTLVGCLLAGIFNLLDAEVIVIGAERVQMGEPFMGPPSTDWKLHALPLPGSHVAAGQALPS